MMSSIEWTDATWNPVIGCTPVSSGCANCYAATMAHRLEHMPHTGKLYKGLTVLQGNGKRHFSGRVKLVPERLDEPVAWRTPRRVFVNSMSDLFQAAVPSDWVDQVMQVIALTPRHTYQVLTKRPKRMVEYFRRLQSDGVADRLGLIRDPGWPLPNLWLGTSVEDQATADERIPHLLGCPAAVRFISCEPLLGDVDLSGFIGGAYVGLPGDRVIPNYNAGIGWVIVGGESGPGARHCNVQWIRSIVRRCKKAGVPCFVKQLGTHYVDEVNAVGGYSAKPPCEYGPLSQRLNNRKGADPDEWPADLRVRQWPEESA